MITKNERIKEKFSSKMNIERKEEEEGKEVKLKVKQEWEIRFWERDERS